MGGNENSLAYIASDYTNVGVIQIFVHENTYCRYSLTHCRLNRLSHTIHVYWKTPISILGTCTFGYEIYIFLEKMAKLHVHVFAHSGDPDQTPHFATSDLGLHCLPNTLLRV